MEPEITASPLSPQVLIALTFLLAAALVALWLRSKFDRVHLPNGVKRNTLVKRFKDERASMFYALLREHGLTTEFEGYLVTADPVLVRELLKTKVGCFLTLRFSV
jgi:hypothetical protein